MLEHIIQKIKNKRKTGTWLDWGWKNSVSTAKCSLCGGVAHHYDFHGVQDEYKYCPYCGAEMKYNKKEE